MENRLADPLRRIYKADKSWTDDENEPDTFLLIYTGGGSEVLHPRWDPGWSVPSSQTIDDLEELGLVRVTSHEGKGRTFGISMQGRAEARALIDQLAAPVDVASGHAPPADRTLKWLVDLRQESPGLFAPPHQLLDRAVRDGLIDASGRDAFADQLISLNGRYVDANIPSIQQASGERLLRLVERLELSVAAYQVVQGPAANTSVNVGTMFGGQVAGHDITNNVTIFLTVLGQIYDEIDAVTGYDEETRGAAKRFIDRLRGAVVAESGVVITAATTDLLVEAFKRIVSM